LHEAGLEITHTIEAINQTIVCGGRVGPFRAGRRSRQVGDVRAFPQNERGKGEHFSVRRPGDGVGSLLEIGNARCLAGVHPADVQLLFAVGVR